MPPIDLTAIAALAAQGCVVRMLPDGSLEVHAAKLSIPKAERPLVPQDRAAMDAEEVCGDAAKMDTRVLEPLAPCAEAQRTGEGAAAPNPRRAMTKEKRAARNKRYRCRLKTAPEAVQASHRAKAASRRAAYLARKALAAAQSVSSVAEGVSPPAHNVSSLAESVSSSERSVSSTAENVSFSTEGVSSIAEDVSSSAEGISSTAQNVPSMAEGVSFSAESVSAAGAGEVAPRPLPHPPQTPPAPAPTPGHTHMQAGACVPEPAYEAVAPPQEAAAALARSADGDVSAYGHLGTASNPKLKAGEGEVLVLTVQELGMPQGRRGGRRRPKAEKVPKPPQPLAADDAGWLRSLADNAGYAGLNIPMELGRMQAWCELRQKKPTRRRFLNWLNHAEGDRVMSPAAVPGGAALSPAHSHSPSFSHPPHAYANHRSSSPHRSDSANRPGRYASAPPTVADVVAAAAARAAAAAASAGGGVAVAV